MTGVAALWAIVGKRPGDSTDYRVLACSANEVAWFDALEHPDRPGTPEIREAGQVASLPWVTFGYGSDPEPVQTMSIMEWSDVSDVNRRRTTRTKVFVVPFGRLAPGAGYADLYRAGAATELPPADGVASVDLAPRPGPTATVAAGWAAAAAATVLEGPVVVTGPHEAELDVRLDVADAIMRFLPFGFRADLTVATWSSYPGQARQRLCFGPRAAPDRAEVRLDDEPSPHTDVGQRYHDLLTRYLAEGQETRLTEWLARYRTPLSFDTQAGVAVDIVQDLDLVDHVVREVRSGNGRLARVRRALAERSPAAFAADDLGVVYRFVLELPEADPATELGPYWSDSLCATVVQTARAQPDARAKRRLASAFFAVAARTAAGPDRYLAELATSPAPGAPVSDELLAVCLDAVAEDVAQANWPQLRHTLSSDPASGPSFVLECQETRPDLLPAVLAWLVDDTADPTPAWLLVLHHAANASVSDLHDAVAEEGLRVEGMAVLAVDLVQRRQAWDAFGPPLWRRLLQIASRPHGYSARQFIERTLETTAPIRGAPRTRAYLDVVRLAFDMDPCNAPFEVDALATYVGECAAALQLVPDDRRGPVAHELVRGNLETLVHEAPTIGWAPAAVLVATTLTRLANDVRPEFVAELLAEPFNRSIGACTCGGLVLELDRCGGTVWTELAHSSPRLRDVVQRLRLEQQAATDARPEDLALVWAPIVQRDLLLAEHRTWPSLMALKNWPRRERGNDLLTVLDRTSAAVHQQVGESPHTATTVDEWWRRSIELVLRERVLGDGAATALLVSLQGRVADVERARAERLPGIAERRRQLALQLEHLQREMEGLRVEEDHLDRTCVTWREFVGRYAPDLPTVQARRGRSAGPTEGRFR